MKKILFLFGTRPEAIKMAPLIHTFSNDNNYSVKVGVTAQHREMLDQVIDFFEIKIDYDLNIMKPNQSLHELSANLISKITDDILLKDNFDLVFVQGDTSTVLMGAISSFYQKIPVVHIEAGLRSSDLYSPFPEEMNRVLTSKISKFHFCPTFHYLLKLFNLFMFFQNYKRCTFHRTSLLYQIQYTYATCFYHFSLFLTILICSTLTSG